MGEHYSKVHANNSYVQLSLQSISRGCCSTFFPVFSTPRPAVTEENFPDVSRIIEAVSAVARTPSLVPENDKTRNILYTTAGWFTEESEFDVLKELDIHSYFECPAMFAQSQSSMEKYFEDTLGSVGSWDVSHRMDLGQIDKNKPLLPLKTAEARKRYASYWCKLVYFALNICTSGLPSYLTPSDSIRSVCGSLIVVFSESSLLELLRLLTQDKIAGVRQTENILPVFFRLTSLRKDFLSGSP